MSEFRARLIAGGAAGRLFETLLEQLKDQQLVKPRGRQRTDSTHVLAAIQVLSRLECMGEMLRHALHTLARVAPDWLRAWAPAAWYDRYGQRFQDYRLPRGQAARTALAEEIGADGRQLLAAVFDAGAPAWLREIPACVGYQPHPQRDRRELRAIAAAPPRPTAPASKPDSPGWYNRRLARLCCLNAESHSRKRSR